MTATTSRVTESDNAPGDLNALEAALKEATTKKPATTAPTGTNTNDKPATPQKPEWIQDKFWTGNLEESTRKQAEAYAPLQSAYGRMANDLGTQRKLTDQILSLDKHKQNAQGNTPPPAPKVDPRRLVDNPTETLDAYWREREERLRLEMEERQLQQAAQAAEQAFLAKHTDFNTVTASPEFLSWVNSSPLRKRAAVMAGRGDFSAADELLTEYKALNGQGPAPTDPSRGGQPNPDPNLEAARKAGLETAANSGGAGGDGKPKGKIYRRADLIALKIEKPHVYADPTFQEEILRAYAEGRVK